MNRIEVEIELHRGRIEALEWVTSLDADALSAPRTRSEHDAESWWSHADHFIHTTLIERNFNAMIRRHLAGGQGLDAGLVNDDGTGLRPMSDLMAYVHAFTEEWKQTHQGKPLDELVRIGLGVRAETLSLLSVLSDEQLASKIPNAPWSDGTVGGILAVHGAHARMHKRWADEGLGHAGA